MIRQGQSACVTERSRPLRHLREQAVFSAVQAEVLEISITSTSPQPSTRSQSASNARCIAQRSSSSSASSSGSRVTSDTSERASAAVISSRRPCSRAAGVSATMRVALRRSATMATRSPAAHPHRSTRNAGR